MPDHDWLGAEVTPEVLAEVRADERERIAQAIEATAIHEDAVEAVFRAAFYRDAARIARNGGSDGPSQ